METQNTSVTARGGFEAMVYRLYMEPSAAHNSGSTLEGVIATCFAKMGTGANQWKRRAFFEFLLQMHSRRCFGVLRNPAFIEVLANMSSFGNKTVRPIETWVKDSLTAEGQLASLIRHCFSKYDVPEFMEHVFAGDNKIHMFWYIQLGRGESVHKLAGFPVVFTKRMAHEFRETPAGYTVEQAVRRAQALGVGASVQTAEAVAWSDVIEEMYNTRFRAAAIMFVAKQGTTPAFDQLQQVLQYLVEMFRQDNDYSLKGRTWQSVSNLAAHYHAELAKRRAAEGFSEWERCAVKDYEVEKESGIFKIVQLDTSEALYEEGLEMSHCVAEYAYDCAEGTTAIFSMRRFEGGAFDTWATIEIDLAGGVVVQAKARFNEFISAEAYALLCEWAAGEQLLVDIGYEEYERLQHTEYVPNEADSYISALRIILAVFLFFLLKMCEKQVNQHNYENIKIIENVKIETKG